MGTQISHFRGHHPLVVAVVSLVAAASILAMPNIAMADDGPVTMAPPISQRGYAPDTSFDGQSSASSSVFNWQEIPANEQVPIGRAVFDQGGYQLYDNAGETIVVPFTNNNLYVLQFAESRNGKIYFINDGRAPVLYVPRGGYLENATVSGARWYPFSDRFHPETPVFLGIAPSWSDYCDMGWYPDMYYHGGYWSGTEIGLFTPSFGLFFEIGGHHYYGWDPYLAFVSYHPDFDRIGYRNRDNYRYAGREYWGDRNFHGYSGYQAQGERREGYSEPRIFYGGGHPFDVSPHERFGDSAFPYRGRPTGTSGSEGSFHGGNGEQYHNDRTFRESGGGFQSDQHDSGQRGSFQGGPGHLPTGDNRPEFNRPSGRESQGSTSFQGSTGAPRAGTHADSGSRDNGSNDSSSAGGSWHGFRGGASQADNRSRDHGSNDGSHSSGGWHDSGRGSISGDHGQGGGGGHRG